MSELKADEEIDLTGVPCPQNAARALLRLETMETGELLRIVIDDGEPIEQVPNSVTEEGHALRRRDQLGDGRWVLFIEVA
ncbi:MAG: hypothetical protein CME06_06865 [Gemmatimonadetes bacterium]|nr:hypothetical protein [Gemmatimonadota bacterium]